VCASHKGSCPINKEVWDRERIKDDKEAEIQLISLTSEELKPLKRDTHFTIPTILEGIDDELKSNNPGDFEHWKRNRNEET
jgi:hypothetical protein